MGDAVGCLSAPVWAQCGLGLSQKAVQNKQCGHATIHNQVYTVHVGLVVWY